MFARDGTLRTGFRMMWQPLEDGFRSSALVYSASPCFGLSSGAGHGTEHTGLSHQEVGQETWVWPGLLGDSGGSHDTQCARSSCASYLASPRARGEARPGDACGRVSGEMLAGV